jgi:hypothetical protein
MFVLCVLVVLSSLESTGIIPTDALTKTDLSPTPTAYSANASSEYMNNSLRLQCRGRWIRKLICGSLSLGADTQSDFNQRRFPDLQSQWNDQFSSNSKPPSLTSDAYLRNLEVEATARPLTATAERRVIQNLTTKWNEIDRKNAVSCFIQRGDKSAKVNNICVTKTVTPAP